MIEKINEMWEQDANIDRNKLTEETLKSPNLHQKYITLLMQCKNRVVKLEHEIKNLKFAKYKYYKCRMTREELEYFGWEQYQGIKPNGQEMSFLMENDSDIVELNTKLQYINNCTFQLESILQQIKNRDWVIKNHIEWEKFQSGN